MDTGTFIQATSAASLTLALVNGVKYAYPNIRTAQLFFSSLLLGVAMSFLVSLSQHQDIESDPAIAGIIIVGILAGIGAAGLDRQAVRSEEQRTAATKQTVSDTALVDKT